MNKSTFAKVIIVYDGNQMKKLAIFCSGGGSNFSAICAAQKRGEIEAEISFLICDSPDIGAIEKAKQFHIPTIILDCRKYQNLFPIELQEKIATFLQSEDIDLICLAGWMRMIKSPLLKKFPNRILNIHPSLLPSFPGLDAWKQAFDSGAEEMGCTIHYVDTGMDTGEIIAQRKVRRCPEDTLETLKNRIQEAEHILYPETLGNLLNSSQK